MGQGARPVLRTERSLGGSTLSRYLTARDYLLEIHDLLSRAAAHERAAAELRQEAHPRILEAYERRVRTSGLLQACGFTRQRLHQILKAQQALREQESERDMRAVARKLRGK